jgi:Flp pilus assembly pilin Flp
MRSGKRKSLKGQALTEYALIITFIALVCVAGLAAMGASLNGFFSGSGGWF